MAAKAFIVEVVKATAQAVVEDGAARNGECAILADGEASSVEGIVLCLQIVLELVVGDDFTRTLALVCEDAACEGAEGLGGAGSYLSLRKEISIVGGLIIGNRKDDLPCARG